MISALGHADRRPILVTGMPRSGTTWVARLLAGAPQVALTGREPMNARGRQYALGGTLSGWERLTSPSRRQSLALRTAYAGWNPLVYSRYGRDQWTAPMPWVRLVVKDPFALLSLTTVHRLTGAAAVVVYRHPGAALASYRRMGWSADIPELAPIVQSLLKSGPLPGVSPPPTGRVDEVAAMGWFWSALYGIARHDLAHTPGAVLVSHAELAGGGAVAEQKLFEHLGLRWPPSGQSIGGTGRVTVDQEALHNFDRPPGAVAEEWRQSLTTQEIAQIEDATEQTREALERHRLPLLATP